MRNPMAVFAIICLLGVGVASQATEQAKQGEMCLLRVSGMHCGACARSVEQAAKKVPGVTTAKASQPKGTAEVTYDPAKTSPDAIAKAINEKTSFKAEVAKSAQR